MSMPERELTLVQALNEALHEEMERDERVMVLGEDVGRNGGVYKVTDGLLDRFGSRRVLDTPISEAAIAGVGVGAAMTGMRPVVEIMFGDFLSLAMDQIVNQAAKVRYMSGGKLGVPFVVRTTLGAGRRMAAQHSQSLHAVFAHIPGVKVVLPSSPADAKGLLKAAIRDEDPVVFFEDKLMYREKGMVDEGEHVIALGRAEVKRAGTDITIVATSSMVGVALTAAETLSAEGIEAEVVDPRTVSPLDVETIVESVRKTSRCVVVDEGCVSYGASAEIAATVAREAFYSLEAPVTRIGAMDVPVPFSPPLEDLTIPSHDDVVGRVRELVQA
jgi:acetoin:2,6-dichlorophenolindophenol oxidoreductase subunit beta